MASIIRRKDNKVVTYYFTNLVDINNIDLESSPANITLKSGAKPLRVGDINTTTHEVVNDVTAVHTWYGNVFKYDDTDGWSIDTTTLNNINHQRKKYRDQDESSEPEDLKVYLTQADYDADQEE